MSSLIHRHKHTNPGDGSPPISHTDLLDNDSGNPHPQYVLGHSTYQRQYHGTVSFPAGTATVAVVFPAAFLSAPIVIAIIEKTGAVQSAGIDSVTTSGFNLNRSSSGGAAIGHWIAIGTVSP